MKRTNKIIMTSLIIGVMSIAGTAMAEAAPKNHKPEHSQTIIVNNYNNKNYDKPAPPKHDENREHHRPESHDRKVPPKPKGDDRHSPHGKTPPPPPEHKENKGSGDNMIKIIINKLF